MKKNKDLMEALLLLVLIYSFSLIDRVAIIRYCVIIIMLVILLIFLLIKILKTDSEKLKENFRNKFFSWYVNFIEFAEKLKNFFTIV